MVIWCKKWSNDEFFSSLGSDVLHWEIKIAAMATTNSFATMLEAMEDILKHEQVFFSY
jgi:hypothetical protein